MTKALLMVDGYLMNHTDYCPFCGSTKVGVDTKQRLYRAVHNGEKYFVQEEQGLRVRNFAVCFDVYNGRAIVNMIAAAKYNSDEIAINADW